MKAVEAITILWRLAPETEVKLEYPEQPNFKAYNFGLEKDGANFLATLLDFSDLDEPTRFALKLDGDEKQVLMVQGNSGFQVAAKITQDSMYRDYMSNPDFIASLPIPIPHLATRGLSDLIWEDVYLNEYRIVEYQNQTYVIWRGNAESRGALHHR